MVGEASGAGENGFMHGGYRFFQGWSERF